MNTNKIIRECCRGSIISQKYFFDKYAASMYLVCRRYMRTNEAAEDVMMNGFFQCFKSLPGFSYTNDSALAGWLKRIFINECLQVLRKKNNLVVVPDDEADLAVTNSSVLDELSADEIYKLISQLPIGYKTVFNLFVVEGYSHKEIASILNINEGTSKSQLSKARMMLQHMIMKNNKTNYAAII